MSEPRTAAAPALPERPYLRPWYRVDEDDGRLAFEYAHTVVLLEGAAARAFLPRLLPLLDGTRTVDDLAAVLGSAVRPAIVNALATLGEHGLLTDGPPLSGEAREPDETADLLAALGPGGLSPAAARRALAAATIGLVGADTVGEDALRLLLGAGVREARRLTWAAADDGLDLVIAAPAAPELPRLDEWNRAAIESATPWLQVLPYDGRYAAIGPLFLPGETACHRCFLLRRAAVSDYRSEFWGLARRPAYHPSAPALRAVAAGVAALLAVRWLAWRDALVPGRVLGLELGTAFALRTHAVHRVPRCPVCSGVADAAPPLPWFKETAGAR